MTEEDSEGRLNGSRVIVVEELPKESTNGSFVIVDGSAENMELGGAVTEALEASWGMMNGNRVIVDELPGRTNGSPVIVNEFVSVGATSGCDAPPDKPEASGEWTNGSFVIVEEPPGRTNGSRVIEVELAGTVNGNPVTVDGAKVCAGRTNGNFVIVEDPPGRTNGSRVIEEEPDGRLKGKPVTVDGASVSGGRANGNFVIVDEPPGRTNGSSVIAEGPEERMNGNPVMVEGFAACGFGPFALGDGPLADGAPTEYGYGGGVIVRVTRGWLTPDSDRGLGSSVMVNGGGRILLVSCTKALVAPELIRTFHILISVVVTGGIVRTVVWVVLSMPVEVDTRPFLRVVIFVVDHATSREVVKSGNVIVVVLPKDLGGKM